MSMNTTSQNPGNRFPFNSGPNAMDNRSLYLTLAVSAGLAFLITLIIYASISGRNPLTRVGYGILVSLVPALGVIAVIKITRLLVSRVGAVFIYTILFVLVLLLQAVGRLIPVYT
jgi:hypothetical protein